jgi:hypothetical protein
MDNIFEKGKMDIELSTNPQSVQTQPTLSKKDKLKAVLKSLFIWHEKKLINSSDLNDLSHELTGLLSTENQDKLLEIYFENENASAEDERIVKQVQTALENFKINSTYLDKQRKQLISNLSTWKSRKYISHSQEIKLFKYLTDLDDSRLSTIIMIYETAIECQTTSKVLVDILLKISDHQISSKK